MSCRQRTRKSHWDLLLEPELATAEASAAGLLPRLGVETPLDGPQPLKAERLADHRRLYLVVEGRLAATGGGYPGAAGEYRMLEDSAAEPL